MTMNEQSAIRRARVWAVPVIVLAVLIGVALVRPATARASSPNLPPRDPAQLLAQAAQSWRQPFSGTVERTMNLGLPALPDVSGGAGGAGGSGGLSGASASSLTTLLTGTHAARVWYASPQRFRVATLDQMAEIDVVRDGTTLWTWQSKGQQATRYTLPVHSTKAAPPSAPTGQIRQLLSALQSTTNVSAAPTARVAGRDAYQLTLTPKAPASTLVGSITVALDAGSGLPLRLQVFARGADTPAVEVGFTSIRVGQPDPDSLGFTPPAGAHIIQGHLAETAGPARGSATYGNSSGWTAYAPLSRVGSVPHTTGPNTGGPHTSAAHPTFVGSGWGAVAVLPASGLAQAAGPLLAAARPVSGSWGSGRLLTSSLVNALLTNDGRLLVGAVPASTLYAAAGQHG